MANAKEWVKGILIFLVFNLIFYFYWDNIFSNLLEFLAEDWINAGASADTSLAILKTLGWVSFVFLYIMTTCVYLIVSIFTTQKTNPIELFKAVMIWALSMPLFSIFYGLMYLLISSLETATSGMMDAATLTMAGKWSWFFAFFGLMIMVCVPFYFILKGYGIELGERKVEE